MAFLNKALKWLSPGQEPSEDKKTQGFQNGEFPAPGHFDFMFKSTFDAIEELQEKAIEKTTAATSTSLGLVRNGSNIDNNSGVLSVKNSTTSARGVVQLNDTTTSSLSTVAATARALKEVADLANTKVDKIVGKGLSTNDFTQLEKDNLFNLSRYVTNDLNGAGYVYEIGDSLPTILTNGIYSARANTTGTYGAPTNLTGVIVKYANDWYFLGFSTSGNMYVGNYRSQSWQGWVRHYTFSDTHTAKLQGIAENANNYTLPTASTTVTGGVYVGPNIDVTGGRISVKDATTTQKGVVQLNDTITSASTSQAPTARAVKEVADNLQSTSDALNSKLTNTETALNNKITANQNSIRTINEVELPKYYKNGSGGGTLSNATSLSAGGIVSKAGSFFVGVDTLLIVANKNGYNGGNGTTLMPMRADYYEGNRLISEATRHLYFGTDGNVRVTSRGTSTNETITYRPIQASSFDVASSYTYKQDISEMTRSALDIVDVLKIHEYRLIGDVENGVLDNWQIGLIAEYSPQVATDENMKIDTYKMQSLNWKATQELYQIAKGHEMTIGLQQTQIDEQKQQIDEQKQQIDDLRQEIADIKAMLQS